MAKLNPEHSELLPKAPATTLQHLSKLISLALPNTFTTLLWDTQSMISLYFLGLLRNVTYLDAYSLASSWACIFAFSVIIGLSSGLDTLVSQSFGRGDHKICGTHLVRGLIVVSLAAIPCYVLVYLSGPLLRLIGVNPALATYCHECAIGLIPTIALYIPHIMLEKFMLGQKIATPPMVIQSVNTLLYPLYCYVFMFTCGMSYMGAVMARACAEVFHVLGMVLYLYFSGCCSRTLTLPRGFHGIWRGCRNYADIAFPTMTMVCLEFWACVSLSVLCAKVGVVDLAVHAISCNYGDIIFSTCMGMGTATSALVGNSIGERSLANAKKYCLVGVFFTASVIVLIQLPVLMFRNQLVGLFTKDQAVTNRLLSMMFLVTFRELFDGMQCTLGRTLIGMGRQAYASRVNLVVYYLIMVPLAIVFGYSMGYGVKGVWIATTISAIIVTACFAVLIMIQDWDALMVEAEERAIKEGASRRNPALPYSRDAIPELCRNV